jgi:diguanylate cyclase (GGDEF)-like protein
MARSPKTSSSTPVAPATAGVKDTDSVAGNDNGIMLPDSWREDSEVRRRRRGTCITLDVDTLDELSKLAQARDAAHARLLAAGLTERLGRGVGALLGTLIDALVEGSEERERLQLLAGRDELTGIANRRSFNEALAREVARAHRGGGPVALLTFDLDGLKGINDRYGHPTGDAVLVALARAATAAVRDEDVVARIGGDEFAVVLAGADGGDARAVGERIRQHLDAMSVEGVRPQMSYGFAVGFGGGASAERLVAAADAALYRNKLARRTLRPPA